MNPPSPTAQPESENGRCGIAALVGRANVGKSSLLNRILDEKVSIVSPVAQTTRNPVRAVLTEPRGQLVFLDTPGIHAARTDLGRLMNRSARASIEGVDAVLLVVDRSRAPRAEDEGWMRRLTNRTEPGHVFLVLNQRDNPATFGDAYRKAWADAQARAPIPVPAETIEVSAVSGEGIDLLLDRLFLRMPLGPRLFPDDVLTDYPKRLAISDTVREKLFLRLNDEIPHCVAVWVENLTENPDGWIAETVVLVERPTQKGIVIGHKGRMLRAVRRASETELRSAFGLPVTVHLHVKVEPKWTGNYWILKRLGLIG